MINYKTIDVLNCYLGTASLELSDEQNIGS